MTKNRFNTRIKRKLSVPFTLLLDAVFLYFLFFFFHWLSFVLSTCYFSLLAGLQALRNDKPREIVGDNFLQH